MSRLIPLVRVPPVRDLHPDESTRGIFASTILSNGNYRIVYSRSKKEKINFHPIFVPKKTRRKSLNFSAYTSSILLKILTKYHRRYKEKSCLNLCSATNSLQESPIKRRIRPLSAKFSYFIPWNSVFDASEIPSGGFF